MDYILTNKRALTTWYREQLMKFLKLGIGNVTEHNVTVSKKLINTTRKRIVQLSGKVALHHDWGKVERKPSKNPSTNRVRLFRAKQKLKELKHGQRNGTITTLGSKNISTDGHEGGTI